MSQHQTVFDWLQDEVKPTVDEWIQNRLSSFDYADRLWYPISTGGKRWRPGLALLVAQLCGLDEDDGLDIAAGTELLHNFTLVHDDVMDGDEQRRGEPAVWVKYGKESAINLGDMMFAEAIICLTSVTWEAALETVVQITQGQQMDLDFEDRRDISVDEYLTMVERKTGALLDLCVRAPQVVAGIDIGLEGYSSLGPAFQIRDDLLDFEPGKGRKHVGNDIRAGKRTLMVVHADDDRLYDILDKPFDSTTPEDVNRARAILEEHGSMEFAHDTMTELADQALTSLEVLPESDERAKLRGLGAFLIERGV
jgi:geranylgeranyl diphosphate synthase type I